MNRNLSGQTCDLYLCKQEGLKNLEQRQEEEDGSCCALR
jgi:hypothetical protein